MAYNNEGLAVIRRSGVIGSGSGSVRSVWAYVTNDAASVVETDGYFDGDATKFTTGDIILASMDVDGTPAVKTYVVTASSTDVALTLSVATAAA